MWIEGITGPVWVDDSAANINTGMYTPVSDQTTTYDEFGNPVAFNHASRLLDKLFGAVEVRIDNYMFEDRITNLRNSQLFRSVQQPIAYLPAGVAEWFNRNIMLVMGVVFVGIFSFVLLKFARK